MWDKLLIRKCIYLLFFFLTVGLDRFLVLLVQIWCTNLKWFHFMQLEGVVLTKYFPYIFLQGQKTLKAIHHVERLQYDGFTVMWSDQLYIAEENKSIKREDSPQSMWPSSDLDTILSVSHYFSADNKFKSYRLKASGSFWPLGVTEECSRAPGSEGLHAVGFPLSKSSACRIRK